MQEHQERTKHFFLIGNVLLRGNAPKLAPGYIAQWLERLTADQQAPGSNPGVPSCQHATLARSGQRGDGHLLETLVRSGREAGRVLSGFCGCESRTKCVGTPERGAAMRVIHLLTPVIVVILSTFRQFPSVRPTTDSVVASGTLAIDRHHCQRMAVGSLLA